MGLHVFPIPDLEGGLMLLRSPSWNHTTMITSPGLPATEQCQRPSWPALDAWWVSGPQTQVLDAYPKPAKPAPDQQKLPVNLRICKK